MIKINLAIFSVVVVVTPSKQRHRNQPAKPSNVLKFQVWNSQWAHPEVGLQASHATKIAKNHRWEGKAEGFQMVTQEDTDLQYIGIYVWNQGRY